MTQSILLVEDEPVLRVTTRDSLAARGYRVHELGDGARAIELLKGIRFDAVVTDLMLPGATGLDLLRQSRRLRPAPLVVLITAFGSVPVAVEAMRHGAYDFFTKPFRVEELEASLERGLSELERQRSGAATEPDPECIAPLAMSMARHERDELHQALKATGGRRSEAARLLGISRKALWEKLKRLG